MNGLLVGLPNGNTGLATDKDLRAAGYIRATEIERLRRALATIRDASYCDGHEHGQHEIYCATVLARHALDKEEET